jgi:hypothetical protein|tara:strand:+ start:2381 stop:2638 length:258 start_codon:yes stop_codon:yes gene_type:complete
MKVGVILETGVFTFCILFLLSWTWLLTIFLRAGFLHPLETMEYLSSDLAYIGPFAFLLDILVFLIIFTAYKRAKSKQLDKDTHNG